MRREQPHVQMGECGTLGRFFDPIERGKWRNLLGAEQARECLLLCIRQVRKNALIDPSIDEGANTSGQAIQRAKGRQFTVLGEQHLDSSIDEIRRVVHHLG